MNAEVAGELEPARVVMAVTGTAGDILPLVALGRHLVTLGHEVSLVSHAPFAPQASAAGIEFESLDTIDEYEDLLRSSETLVGRVYDLAHVEESVGWYHTPARRRREFSAVVDRIHGRRAVVIGRYISNSVAMAAAERHGVGRAWSLVSPHALSEAVAIGELHGPAYLARLNAERRALGLADVANWLDWTENAGVRLCLWPSWFAPDSAFGRSAENSSRVGFVADTGKEEPPLSGELWDFLADGDAPVVVTAGSGRMIAPGFFGAAVGGAFRARRRVILVSRFVDELPTWTGDGLLRLPTAPLAKLLPRAAAIVHHGGIGTSATALAAAVPQLVLAEGVDRPDNGRRLSDLGVAEALPPPAWTPANVATALDRLTRPNTLEALQRCAALVRRDAADGRAGLTVEGLFCPARPVAEGRGGNDL